MGMGHIVIRAHFDQTRHRAIEFERLASLIGLIQLMRLFLRGGNQLDVIIIEHVDQRNKAFCLVAALEAHLRNILDHHGMEFFGNRQIIGRAQRFLAQIGKGEAGDTRNRKRHLDRMTQHRQRHGLGHLPASQPRKSLVNRLCRRAISRHMIDRQTAQFFHAEIRARIEFHHLHAFDQQIDKGQKQSAVQPAFIKPVGHDIGGCDHHHALIKQGCEQAAQDHRIGNIGDGEFIKTNQMRLTRQSRGDRRDRIRIFDRALFHALAEFMDAFMHIRHETMKMHAPFGGGLHRLEKQIHQHGFAAPDIAPDIGAFGRFGSAFVKQPAQSTAFGGNAALVQGLGQLVEMIDNHELRAIALDGTGLDKTLILMTNEFQRRSILKQAADDPASKNKDAPSPAKRRSGPATHTDADNPPS